MSITELIEKHDDRLFDETGERVGTRWNDFAIELLETVRDRATPELKKEFLYELAVSNALEELKKVTP